MLACIYYLLIIKLSVNDLWDYLFIVFVHFFITFQVDPRKHRLLFEVFDENRLVSFWKICTPQTTMAFGD